MRVQQEQAFVLHARPFSESSLVLDVFTPGHGRLGLLAKGSRRPGSRMRGLLKPFQPLLIGWSGRGDLPVLTVAENDGECAPLKGTALYCGFYLNELLMRLLHRHDPHEALYRHYRTALFGLQPSSTNEAVLRVFEKQILRELGYGLVLERDVPGNAAVKPELSYLYVPDRGPMHVDETHSSASVDGIRISGSTLLALAGENLETADHLREAKRLMRTALARHLGEKPLHSRRLFGRENVDTERHVDTAPLRD
jgi:DNA repair protein RecO (recombination protein O)